MECGVGLWDLEILLVSAFFAHIYSSGILWIREHNLEVQDSGLGLMVLGHRILGLWSGV